MSTFATYYTQAPEDTRATGRAWYALARATVHAYAAEFGANPCTVAGIIAALSPRQTWAQNLKMARACLARDAAGLRGLGDPIRKACAIRDGAQPLDILRGDKVRAFYRAICGESTAVVLDVWMLRAAGFTGAKPTPKQYADIAEVLTRDALTAGEAPADFQAIVWCQIRGRAF